jgi:hypothetical protein
VSVHNTLCPPVCMHQLHFTPPTLDPHGLMLQNLLNSPFILPRSPTLPPQRARLLQMVALINSDGNMLTFGMAFVPPMLQNAGHVGPYASLTHLLILMMSLPCGFYCADCSIVLVFYCPSHLVQCYCLEPLLFSFPIVLDLLLIVHPSLVEQLA